MLDSIPTDTIHATGFQVLDVLTDDGLHSRIVGIKVFHTNLAMCHVITVIPIDTMIEMMVKTLIL